MPLQRLLKPLPQCSRLLDQFVAQGVEEPRKLLLRPIQNILCKQPSSRTKLPNDDLYSRAQHAPHLLKLPRQQSSKDCMHIARCIEIAGFAELRRIPRVVAQLGIVKANLHVAREGNWPALSDLRFDIPPQFVHIPFLWRSLRSCGVRINISTK